MRRKLTYEFCKEECKKYHYYTEIRDNDLSLYMKCRDTGWINDFDWLEDNRKKYDLESPIHLVYAYEFNDTKTAYIGRTIQMAQRHYTHKHPRYGKKDSVLEYCEKMSIDFPKPKVLETGLTLIESKTKEKSWCDDYASRGYILLNKAKTGEFSSSVGGLAIKWTKDEVEKESKKYNRLIDFRNNSFQAYKVALKHKWIDEFDWLKRERVEKNHWTFDECYKEAEKYSTVGDYKKLSPSSYVTAVSKGWAKEFTWLYPKGRPKTRWTDDTCREEAKKYNTRYEFQNNMNGCYQYARTHGLLDTFDWMKTKSVNDTQFKKVRN